MNKNSLLSTLFKNAKLPAGRTISEIKADEDAAWRRRQADIHNRAFAHWATQSSMTVPFGH